MGPPTLCAAVSRYRATACSARRCCRWRWQRWQHRWSEPAPRLNVGSHYAAQYLVLCAAVGIVRPRVQHGVFAGPRRPAVRGEHRGRGRQRSLAMPPEENLEIKEGPRAATALGAAGSGTALGRTKSRKRGSQAHKGIPVDASPLVRTRARAASLPRQALNPLCQRPRFRAPPPTMEASASARRIRLQERRWCLMARGVLTIERQATGAAAFGQFWEVIGRWQNLALGLWLGEDALHCMLINCNFPSASSSSLSSCERR